jgi:hypothetical protein
MKEIINKAIRRKKIEKQAKRKKTETELEREARHADNFVFFINKIVEHKFPKAKPWQKEILIHAQDRGLLSIYTYDNAQLEYYCITNEWKS